MFIENKYTRIYFKIIDNAKLRGNDKSKINTYTESHHIIPVSLNGDKGIQNTVLLTAKEHFICHRLLIKMTNGWNKEKMKHAFSYMVFTNKNRKLSRKINSNQFELARKILSSTKRSPQWKQQISDSKRGKTMSRDSIEKMRKTITGRKLSKEHRMNISKNTKGFSKEAREASKLSLSKNWLITLPDGKQIKIFNLKDFCKEQKLNYSTAHNNSKQLYPIRSGKMKGYKFSINT